MTKAERCDEMCEKSPEILVCGHLGAKNFGDELMMKSLVVAVGEVVPEGNVTVLTKNRQVSRKALGMVDRDVKCITPSIIGVLAGVLMTDVLIMCGGTHFHDYRKQGKHLFVDWMKMCRWWLLFIWAKMTYTQVIFSGIGVGPLEHMSYRFLCRQILGCADRLSLRDKSSYQLVQELGYEKKSELTADLVYSLPISEGEQGKDNRETIIGISLRPVFDSYAQNPQKDSNYVRCIANELNSRLPGGRFNRLYIFACFPSMDLGLAGELHRHTDIESRIIAFDGNVNEMLREMSLCDCFIGFRLHSGVAAARLGLPLFMIDYHPKCTAFADEIGLASECQVQLENLCTEKFVERIGKFLRAPRREYEISKELQTLSRKNIKGVRKHLQKNSGFGSFG